MLCPPVPTSMSSILLFIKAVSDFVINPDMSGVRGLFNSGDG